MGAQFGEKEWTATRRQPPTPMRQRPRIRRIPIRRYSTNFAASIFTSTSTRETVPFFIKKLVRSGAPDLRVWKYFICALAGAISPPWPLAVRIRDRPLWNHSAGASRLALSAGRVRTRRGTDLD